MLNIQNYLLNQNIEMGVYALVAYDNTEILVRFTKYNIENKDWFLESPCDLFKVCDVIGNIDSFCLTYTINNFDLLDGESYEEYSKKYIEPMVKDNVLYEINCFQTSPFLPKEVDSLKIISDDECLNYLLST